MADDLGPGPSGFEVEAGVDADVVAAKVDRHLVSLFWCLGIVCYLDRTNLSFAAVQLNRDLGLSCSVYGLGAGLFFASYSLGQIPSNMALARLGAPLWLSAIVAVWGATAACFALIRGPAAFLALRLALGLAECGTFPGMWLHLSRFYSPRELGLAYAKVATSTGLAQVIGAPLAAGILWMDGALGLRGWQWLFIVEGLTTVAFGVALRLLLPPSPAAARFLTPAERAWLQRRQDAQPTASDGKDGAGAVLRVLRNWRVWWMAAAWAGITAAMYSITFFAPMMIHKMFLHPVEAAVLSPPLPAGQPAAPRAASCSGEGGGGGSGAAVALMTMLPFAAAAGAMVLNARHAQAANERHLHAGVPIALGALFMALTPLMLRFVAPLAAFASLVLAAASVWAFHGPFMSWPATFLRGTEAAAGFAAINSVGSLGGVLGPSLIGYLADRYDSYAVAMGVLATLLAASSAGILLFPVPTAELEPAVVAGGSGGSGGELVGRGTESGSGERQPMLPGDACSHVP
jgi:MFS family permease